MPLGARGASPGGCASPGRGGAGPSMPRPTSVTVPSQRSVVMNVAVPLAGDAVAAPPTARKTPLAVIDSERTAMPFGGPLAWHGRSAPAALTSDAVGGIFFDALDFFFLRACRIWKMPARNR